MEITLLLCIVFIGSIARGYSGFGLSAIVITVASYFVPAKELVPLLILLEITASLLFMRGLIGHVDWKTVAIIFAGAAVSTPLALQALLYLPDDITRAVIAALALLATAVLLIKKNPLNDTNNKIWFATGIAMGVFGGLGSIGGLAGMVMLMSTTMEAAKARATMIVLLLITSLYAAFVTAINGLLTTQSLQVLPLLLLPLLLGLYLGHTLFKRFNKSFRTATLILLTLLSATMLLQSITHIYN